MTDTSADIKVETTGVALSGGASVRDYIALLKPRVMSLVVFSGFAGLIVAPGYLHPLLAAVAVLCIAVSAGAAGAINMWYDRDIDAIMERTKSRPLPKGRISPEEALSFGVTLTLFSTMLMGLAVNWTAAILLASANAFYVFIYTMWLKRSTPHNIVIGGAAGAFPPMIGWAAVTGSVDLQSIVLFLIIFMWTPPHFWALALFREGDYAKAGVPMLPVVAGTESTKRQMLLYTLVLVPITLLPSFLGTAGPLYGAAAVLLGLRFIYLSVQVLRDDGVRYAKRMFGFSIMYLFALFGLMMLDRAPGLLSLFGLTGAAG
ncbi:heme o synthase [Denitrobaculum tricleocarpae]|uniref:Protoheme IX farnesyltransferase n=1 Tax=Denitrobaculum tricleocarpae TaxID=2591009 RepID=A0A545U237_9PROT|nr:heme o synthase [Denitrobaculum tricleocarpae]TQV83463.1 protoheme IX farnesyltransferase [Denitrobaculum tricleocarpae]